LELFLKILLHLEQNQWPLHHDCRGLFDDLSEQSQDSIKASYDARLAERAAKDAQIERLVGFKLRHTFAEALADSATAFESFRYPYEGRAQKSFMGAYLAEAAKKRIVELRPQWGAELQGSAIHELLLPQPPGRSASARSNRSSPGETSAGSAAPQLNLERAFLSADRFGWAAKLLFEIRPGFFMYPAVICGGLALEIFLKVLLHLEGNF